MKARPVWAFSAIAFEVSRRDHVPCSIRGAFFRLGVASFWAALAFEGRALEVWRDLRSLKSGSEGWRLHRASVGMTTRLKGLLGRRDTSECVPTPAWTLPENHKMRGLGLGRMWAVLCPYCQDFHVHSPGEGRRTPHCITEPDPGRYVLEYAGILPLEHRTRFYRSSKAGLPRLLHHWPEAEFHSHDAAELLAA